jgi:hypothetical protein
MLEMSDLFMMLTNAFLAEFSSGIFDLTRIALNYAQSCGPSFGKSAAGRSEGK